MAGSTYSSVEASAVTPVPRGGMLSWLRRRPRGDEGSTLLDHEDPEAKSSLFGASANLTNGELQECLA